MVDSGQLGIFANGYWAIHSAMKLPPEVNLIAVAHIYKHWNASAMQTRIVAVLGVKHRIFKKLSGGGVANPINLDAPNVLNLRTFNVCKTLY